jgi:hypothetical protein
LKWTLVGVAGARLRTLRAMIHCFGVMNVWTMLGFAAVVLTEKVVRRDDAIDLIAGAPCLVPAVLVLASPSVASALVPKVTPNVRRVHDPHVSGHAGKDAEGQRSSRGLMSLVPKSGLARDRSGDERITFEPKPTRESATWPLLPERMSTASQLGAFHDTGRQDQQVVCSMSQAFRGVGRGRSARLAAMTLKWKYL